MNINDVKISDLKKALNDPKALAAIRKMNPEFANMSDQNFQRLVNNVGGSLDQFSSKFGDMKSSDVAELGKKQELENGNKKGTSKLSLYEALDSLNQIKSFDKFSLREKLNNGTTLVLANKLNGNTAFDTIIKCHDNVLWFYKLIESTSDHIVLTLCQAAKMIPGIFDIVYEHHILKEDMVFEDVKDSFCDVSENTWHMTEDEILAQLKENDILQFQEKK